MPATEFGEKQPLAHLAVLRFGSGNTFLHHLLPQIDFPPEAKKIGWGLYEFGSRISGQSNPRLFEQN